MLNKIIDENINIKKGGENMEGKKSGKIILILVIIAVIQNLYIMIIK